MESYPPNPQQHSPMSDPFNRSKAPLLSASKIMKSVIMSCFSHQKSSVLAEHGRLMKLVRRRFGFLTREFYMVVLNLRLVGMGRNSWEQTIERSEG